MGGVIKMAIRNTKLNGTDWDTGNIITKADINDTNDAMYVYAAPLGEVKMFALSTSGAVTKTSLQANGFAICDGTTPVSQGISSPTITTTPNLENNFIKGSDDETSGTSSTFGTTGTDYTFTEFAFFIKVK